MSKPIEDDAEALRVAAKIIVAQDKLLAAYRSGSARTPGAAIDTLTKHRPRLDAYFHEGPPLL